MIKLAFFKRRDLEGTKYIVLAHVRRSPTGKRRSPRRSQKTAGGNFTVTLKIKVEKSTESVSRCFISQELKKKFHVAP